MSDVVYVVLAALVPPIWLVVGLIGLATRSQRNHR